MRTDLFILSGFSDYYVVLFDDKEKVNSFIINEVIIV